MNISTILWTAWSCTYLTLIGLLLAALAIFLILVILQLNRISDVPPNIPWVGLKDRKYFPKLRACFGEFSAGRSMVDEGYEKYGKHDKPFIIPGMNWNGVVLPPSNNAWVAHQPETVLSGNKVLDDTLGLEYLTHGPSAASCRDFTVIRRDLTRQIVNLTDQISDEISSSLDDLLGFDSDWKEVKMTEIIGVISFRAANRIFVGLPQCRSKAYRNAVSWWTTVYGTGILLSRQLIPSAVQKFLMPLIAIPTKVTEWWAISYLMPDIKKRLRKLGNSTGEKAFDKENDMMQWIINENGRKANPDEMQPANIAGKMLLFNIFATATTSMLVNTILFTVLPHEEATSVLAELREEADRILPEVDLDGRLVRDMVKTDSVIRETLRCSPLGGQGMFREVVKPGGLYTPDGLHLPQGTHVQVVVSTMQQDSAIYGENATKYDPLRYCRSVTTASGNDGHVQEAKNTMAVQISEEFLSFGLGKHACPGRFFAVHVVKLILGYLLMRYDIQPLAEKPEFAKIGEALVPPSKTSVKLRRRKTSDGDQSAD